VLSPHIGLNAGIAHGAAAGELALLSHSSSLSAAMLDWARARHIGFSHVVSLGKPVDIDDGDLLDHLASDPRTRAILLCTDEIAAPRKFMSAARAAARNKPVIVVRWLSPGASAGGERASDHASDRASDLVHDAAFARAGMLRVATLQDMLLAAETLVRFRANRSERLLIVGNGGGATALAAQAAARAGVRLAAAPQAALDALRPLLAAGAAPSAAPAPLLLRADATPAQLALALQGLAEAAGAAALLLIHAPTPSVPSEPVARALLPLAQLTPPRLIGCWLGHDAAAAARSVFQQAGLPSYDTPEAAVQAFSMLLAYRRNQAQLIEAPPLHGGEIEADAASARALVQRALAAGRMQLDADETRRLLGGYGIAVRVAHRTEAEPYAAASAAERLGYPVLLQIVSPDIAAGFDGGGMTLDLRSAVQVRDAARRMAVALRRDWPGARVDGFSVEPMARPAARCDWARASTRGSAR
jgi:acetyltransferase